MPSMQITVHLQLRCSTELLRAHITRKPVDVFVEQLVDVQGRFLFESLAACVADEGSGVGVDVAVVVARRFGGKAFAAYIAGVFFYAVVVFVDVTL